MLGMLSSGKSIMEISDSKKKELIGKTMKEVNRGIAEGEAYAATTEGAAAEEGEAQPTTPEASKGPGATQEGVQQAGLTQGQATTEPLPPGNTP